MDARKYDPLNHVSPGQFTDAQRQRLEAFTASVGLLGKGRDMTDLLDVAQYIADGKSWRDA